MLACHINHLIYAVITTNTTTDAADVDTDTAAALAALCAEEEHALEDFEEVRTYVTLKEEECRSLLPLHTLCRTTPIVYSSLLSSLFYFLFLSLSSHPSIPLTSSLSSLLSLFPFFTHPQGRALLEKERWAASARTYRETRKFYQLQQDLEGLRTGIPAGRHRHT